MGHVFRCLADLTILSLAPETNKNPMAEIPSIIDDLLRLAVEHGASDIHLKTGRTALFRVDGALVPAEMQPLKAEEDRKSVV
jgi:type II secretory ATPase GspE/PulE/Tfp pilus assembly ATPase PilB-like protein